MKVRSKKVLKSEVEGVKPNVSSAVDQDGKQTFPKKGSYFRDARRKKWRLVIRNLPFTTKKEDLQVVCSNFGPFTEIVLPKCRDKRFPDSCAGFAFVQFKIKKDAVTALEKLNLSEIKGRKVAVDWALPKDDYETAKFEEQAKENSMENIKLEVKDEDEEVIKSEAKDECSMEIEGSDGNEDDRDPESEEEGADSRAQNLSKTHSPLKEDVAVSEGRVVFVRNLSYETNDDDLKETFQKFGEIKLAIICRYADSNHSRGTGFLHFVTREDADKCIAALEEEPGIFIGGKKVFGYRAIPKSEADVLEKERLEKKPKDKRNLYLLRLSVIRPGTAAARDMSEADAEKRARLAVMTREKLRNLHMFVSPTRLIVHNLPLSLNDRQLRSICFLAAGNPDAEIVECRIWRDKNVLDKRGEPRSTGFGFVAFSQHIDALNCLRQLNNNPKTFTDAKRPIVEFSIENKAALRLKEMRLRRCQQKQNSTPVSHEEKNRRDLERTKVNLATGGQKPLPSHIGPKIRKRDLKKKLPQKVSVWFRRFFFSDGDFEHENSFCNSLPLCCYLLTVIGLFQTSRVFLSVISNIYT